MLPIVHRELQVAARDPKLHAHRLRGGTLVLLLSAGMIFSGVWRPSSAGKMFQAVSFLALLYCLFQGVQKCADTITEEKRQGTLGLLLLSGLEGFDIILGKLAAALIRSLSGLLSFVPVLAVSLLLGGTTGGEFWRMVLVLCVSLVAALSLCLLVSTVSRSKPIALSMGLMFLWVSVPFILALSVGGLRGEAMRALSPIALSSAGSDAYYHGNEFVFWFGTFAFLVLAALALAAASLLLPRSWQDKPAASTRDGRNRGGHRSREGQKRAAMLDRNPVMWLMFDARSARFFRAAIWVGALVSGATIIGAALDIPSLANVELFKGLDLIIILLVAAAVAIMASLHVAREASRNLAEARTNGTLELVLSTPVKVSEIISGHWLALRNSSVPAVVLLLVLGCYASISTYRDERSVEILFLLKSFAEAIFGVVVSGWVGMWMGLTSKSPARAFFKTVLIGIFLPHLVCTPTLVNQLTLFLIAADRLKVHFRRFVADQYQPHPGFFLSPVPSSNPALPPVLR